MNPKKALKELEKQLRKQPASLVVRIRLAALLHALGRLPEAVDLYRSVAMAYFAQGRLDQAIAVCHSLLEIAPMHQDTHLLLAELDSHRTRRGPSAPDGGEAFDGNGSASWPASDGNGSTPSGDEDAMSALLRRETGPQGRRDAGPMAWRETGPLTRRETGPLVWRESSPFARRDTPDPRVSFAQAAGSPPPGGASPPLRETPVTSRLPLPVVRTTFSGIVPPPDGHTRGEPARAKRSTASVPPPPARHAPELPLGRSQARGDADEDAPTHIADKWVSPFAHLSDGAAQPSPLDVGRAEPMAPAARPTGTGKITNRPVGSNRMPTFQARPRRKLVGSGADNHAHRADGDHHAEPTEYDDGIELARAFGRAFGGTDEARDDARGKLPLLSGLSERSVEAIAAGMVRRRIAYGEMIVRDGETGDSCFVLAHGEARVLKRDPLLPRGDLVEVSRLTDGDLFGEVAMLGDRRRHASVQAVSDCELLEIPRAHLLQVSRRFPEVDSFLQEFYRERLIATLLTTASFFRPLDPAQRTGLLAHFRFTHVDPGTRIVGEAERAGGFFLVVLGAVEITKRVSERRQVLLATLGEGTYFGEMSLLRGEVARASVTATGPTELAVLPAKNFYALVANHPVLWDQVRQEAHRRELEMVQIVTGVTGTV
jgi:CRP-like cAMP-binding protein